MTEDFDLSRIEEYLERHGARESLPMADVIRAIRELGRDHDRDPNIVYRRIDGAPQVRRETVRRWDRGGARDVEMAFEVGPSLLLAKYDAGVYLFLTRFRAPADGRGGIARRDYGYAGESLILVAEYDFLIENPDWQPNA